MLLFTKNNNNGNVVVKYADVCIGFDNVPTYLPPISNKYVSFQLCIFLCCCLCFSIINTSNVYPINNIVRI